ncbi:MAG: DUF3726 domain-containing protein [Silicimonas sp.]|nr:DUF3726 domain-containing protein [Silicimonas sp.]
MSFSLGEVEAMARKAARGAGYPWALADEAGYALRWCEARGFGGVSGLAALLKAVDGRDPADFTPRSLTEWQAPGALCPLRAGTALADGAPGRAGHPLSLGPVLAPVLILPYLADLARLRGGCVAAHLGAARALVAPDGLEISGEWEAGALTLETTGARPAAQVLNTRSDPPGDAWARLEYYAARTYAPATEVSRLKGAGADETPRSE